MKRVLLASLVCAAIVFALAAPASASQGGISGTIPPEVAKAIGSTSSILQLYGGNFQPGPVSFPVCSEDGKLVGTACFRITWCQGFIGYKINVPGMDSNAKLKVKVEGAVVASAVPLNLVDHPTTAGLHAEGWMTWLNVDSEWKATPNPAGPTYPSIQRVYDALKDGTATIVVCDADGAKVWGSNK